VGYAQKDSPGGTLGGRKGGGGTSHYHARYNEYKSQVQRGDTSLFRCEEKDMATKKETTFKRERSTLGKAKGRSSSENLS